MSTTLRFWYKDLNSFIFPFGLASITLRDISIFTGLPVEGSKPLCLLDVHDPFLPHLEFSSTSQTSYSSAIRKWRTYTGVPSTIEHIETKICDHPNFQHSYQRLFSPWQWRQKLDKDHKLSIDQNVVQVVKVILSKKNVTVST